MWPFTVWIWSSHSPSRVQSLHTESGTLIHDGREREGGREGGRERGREGGREGGRGGKEVVWLLSPV